MSELNELKTAVEKAMAEQRVRTHLIPPITDEMGKYWEQPSRFEIEVDDTHALMTKDAFDKLHNYSSSQPTGVYVGKMWKREKENGWWLCWFGDHREPGYCSNNYRKIIVV